VENHEASSMTLPRLMLRNCRRSRKRVKAIDTTGARLTGGSLLLKTFVLRRLLERRVLASDEANVGVLLPPSVGAVVVNAALTLLRRVTVNLNYTASSAVMNSCIKQAEIRHVLTTRKVMQKLDLKIDAELVYLDDLPALLTIADKFLAAVEAYVLPVGMLERKWQLTSVGLDDLLTIIFTSGSTGEPKGVMLSYRNIASNVTAINKIVKLREDDVLLGVLPFFHAFGYTVTLWTVLTLDPMGAYHFSPLDAHTVGKLTHEHRGTILIGTPTFLRTYLKRCEPEVFATLDVVVAGAEKMPQELSAAFERKFGVRPVEGYGATELSPLVSVNIPASRTSEPPQAVAREGTVGRPVPGVEARVVDLDSGEVLPAGKPGMLWIRGPNVMRGYLHHPEKTAQVVVDGWYMTGDVALIDNDGFITITGRESRFSKIGGEMVPHLKIEETLSRLLSPDEEELKAVVTAVPDARRGERLVVLHTQLDRTPDELVKQLQQAGLPNLWIPSPDSFCQVDEIPVLGTGKLDLRALKQRALEKFGDGKA